MAQKDVAKDIRSAPALEQELQISYAQKGVAVLDVYSSEWGQCKAISETFRRLAMDAGDAVHLKFFTVECNSVLQSLKSPDEANRNLHRPKNTESVKETLPESWQPILEERQGQSKPYFLFYKEGRRAGAVEGVNTPLIRAMVKDLCTVKTPASEFITHGRLLEMWEEYFNPEESEVTYEKFMKALSAVCKLTVPLNEEERGTLLEAIGVARDAKEKTVTAEGLQKWIGDDENRTVMQAFTETLPDYEERATHVRLEREAEEKRRAEEEEARRKAEAVKREQEEAEAAKREKEEREKSAKASDPEHIVRALDVEIKGLLEKLNLHSVDDVAETPEAAEIRERIAASGVTSSVEIAPLRLLTDIDGASGAALAALELLKGAGSLTDELLSGGYGSLSTIAALRDALGTKYQTNTMNGNSKIAAALALSDQTGVNALLHGSNAKNFASDFSSGDFFSNKALAATLTFNSVTHHAGPLFAKLPDLSGLEEGAMVVLPPLSLLSSTPTDDANITVNGLNNIVDFQAVSNLPAVGVAWYSKFKVQSIDGSLTFNFDGLVNEDDYQNVGAHYQSVHNADNERLKDIVALQNKAREREEARKRITLQRSNSVAERPPVNEAPADDIVVPAQASLMREGRGDSRVEKEKEASSGNLRRVSQPSASEPPSAAAAPDVAGIEATSEADDAGEHEEEFGIEAEPDAEEAPSSLSAVAPPAAAAARRSSASLQPVDAPPSASAAPATLQAKDSSRSEDVVAEPDSAEALVEDAPPRASIRGKR